MLQSLERLVANCWDRIHGDQHAAASPGDLLLLMAAGSHCCFITVCPWPRDPPGFICTSVRTPPSPPRGRSLCRTDAHITPLTSHCSNQFMFPQRFVFNRSCWNSRTLIHIAIARMFRFFINVNNFFRFDFRIFF